MALCSKCWPQANHPGEVNRLDLLRRVHEYVERGARLLIAYTATLTDAKLIADAEALERLRATLRPAQ